MGRAEVWVSRVGAWIGDHNAVLSVVVKALPVLVALFACFAAWRAANAAWRSAKEAQRTADETRRANRIALQKGGVDILKGLLELRLKLTDYGTTLPSSAFFAFHEHVVLAEFYFLTSIHAAHVALEKLRAELRKVTRELA